ncbi:poly(A) polymerase/tRNA nucleotidyltransferase (CCA-adding enzyme) [Roseomonas alkaliterrae]|uniref:Poly(A) polymerase/tRNA nucleotidyltransferase (CCA-adding enzyme) n=1 Tax=Neoroseomonas alkaliterrae TaxID=1452450 RepID=A0A840Y5F8_9PROT|nr:poly(A) polymerase/tRNA nucleotidyltransferase (CCA-adding enzyme) [Neoroseomonas alkaliterrae]
MSDQPAAVIARPGFLDIPAVASVLAALPGARAVGGCVRDALAGLPSADVDIAAPLPPQEIAAHLRAAGLKVFETGLAHGTLTAVLKGVPVEVTALRRDVLTDGRHAVVEWTRDWREDAARRDFTINAMSLAPDGALFDYFGGRADLAAGKVRFVGDPDTRLTEDYLRALRFFRFQARYGRGEPDAAAVAAIRRAVPGLARLSAERVWMELKRILSVPDPVAAVGLMAETGVLGAVLGLPYDLDGAARLSAFAPDAAAWPWLVALLPAREDPPRLARRLKASLEEVRILDLLAADLADARAGSGRPPRPPMDDPATAAAWVLSGAARHFREEALLRRFADWSLTLHDFGRGGTDGAHWRGARALAAEMPVPVFPLGGADAAALGVPPGPWMGRLLAEVLAWWRQSGCRPSREECLADLARRVAAGPDAASAGKGEKAGSGAEAGGGATLGG